MARPIGRNKTANLTMRISPQTVQLLADLAKVLGLNRTATIEYAIRKVARAEGIPERPLEEQERADNDE